jgi:hypothetical protein
MSYRDSDYLGVAWNRDLQKWHSTVIEKGIKYDCGYFDNDRDACLARDKKILTHGLNKPLQVLKPKNK